eukprot:191447-Rhodomonas_salina.1
MSLREAPGRLCGYQQKDVDNNDMIIIAAPETNRVSAYARPNSETELKCECREYVFFNTRTGVPGYPGYWRVPGSLCQPLSKYSAKASGTLIQFGSEDSVLGCSGAGTRGT